MSKTSIRNAELQMKILKEISRIYSIPLSELVTITCDVMEEEHEPQ